MLQILEMTEAKLATLTSRAEMHGDDSVPAVSLGLELTTTNEILDLIDKDLAPRLFKHPDSKPLPGVRDALTVLACNSLERVLLATKHEGWTLAVDDGIDDTKPLSFGSCKVDKVSVEPMQGGSIVLRMRVGTSDLDKAKGGMLSMHVGQSIWITLIAPKPGEEKKDEKAPKGKKPDAGDLFAANEKAGKNKAAGDKLANGSTLSTEAAWPFPGQGTGSGTPPKLTTKDVTGRAGKQAAKYRDAATGETWSGRGLQPNWLKAALKKGRSLADFEVAKAH